MISENFSQMPQFSLCYLFVHLNYFPLTSRNLRENQSQVMKFCATAPSLLAANSKLQMNQEKLFVFFKSASHIVSSSQERKCGTTAQTRNIGFKYSIFVGFTLFL